MATKETWVLQFSQSLPLSILNSKLAHFLQLCSLLGLDIRFQLLVKTSHTIPKLEKMPLVLAPIKQDRKSPYSHPRCPLLECHPPRTLSGRSIHYLVRQLTIAAAIVMTVNDIYEMIQRFQNAFSCLITAANLRTTYCHPHFTGKHIGRLRDCPRTWNSRSDFPMSRSTPFSMKYFKTQ